jgi:demethylmenaquinone methyltransferase/2-methoxy-6-polyprenyl-1,4-benzoquinol methylase
MTNLRISRSSGIPIRLMPDPAAVNSMFGRIARRYDRANRVLSGGLDIWWRRRLVKAVRNVQPARILDLATGSGDVAFALSRGLPPATNITAMDFCLPMLKEAEAKKAAFPERYANISFKEGDVLNLALPDASYDAVTIAFGLRNLADRQRGLREMRRVLRPGGHLFILEFSQPFRPFRGLYYLYLRQIVPRLAGRVTGDRGAYEYLNNSIGGFPTRAEVSDEVSAAGFHQVQATAMTLGIVALHAATK